MIEVVRALRPSGRCRAVVVASAVMLATALSAAPAPAQGVEATQELVILLDRHVARTAPDVSAQGVESIDGRRPLTKVRTALPVLAHGTGPDGAPWLQVRLPGRPSQPTGWIEATKTKSKSTPWHLVVKLKSRRVSVYHYGRVVKRFSAIVGKKSTPTPKGEFFVEEGESIKSGAGGPYALASSARSHVLQEFEGGPGQIAIHGMGGLSGKMGTAISHGCIRIPGPSITWLAQHVGSGTPLTIR